MAVVRAATSHSLQPLTGWRLAEVAPDLGIESPADLGPVTEWHEALVPGTAASSQRATRRWSFDTPKDFDANDYWYKTTFTADVAADQSTWLCLGGLATLADVWLNGDHLLRSENMYLAHELDLTTKLQEQNELVLRFSSLNVALGARRPRPRFRTRLIERQQLRWFRTTLLGRMPSWTPPAAAVGPWRGVWLERRRHVSVEKADICPRIEGGRAVVRARVRLKAGPGEVRSLRLRVGSESVQLGREADQELAFTGRLEVVGAELWWPNGLGPQTRYPSELVVETSQGEQVFALDPVAFRTIEATASRDGFALVVNSVEIRCRGACWAPTDVVSLGDDTATALAVVQAREAGMNMLRVGGTMVYESDAFYEACDQHGILVWQDYMFANCDYPADDPAFAASVDAEARQFLSRTQLRACIALLCGGSEVEQQIAMLGLPRASWKPELFEHALRKISEQHRPDVPYLSSSPTGKGWPFQANQGITHYYGVGAYLRPLEDARRADVKFASECLAFANVPEAQTLDKLLGEKAPFHDPLWKARVPRDNGPGWDFDDVRDFYVKLLFGVDPLLLRYQNPERALALGRVATGEVMARTLAEWRRGASDCRGALIWLLRDLWPGAGWGIIDSEGVPKAAYYYVKRTMQPRTLFLTDEGVNGLTLHVVNDTSSVLEAEVELVLWRLPATRVAAATLAVSIPPHVVRAVSASELFDHFIDLTHAYRFGPAAYDVAVATLRLADQADPLAEAHYFVGELPHLQVPDLGLAADGVILDSGELQVRVRASSFAQAVSIDVPGFVADDSYFHLSPGQQRTIHLEPIVPSPKARGRVHALNGQAPARITLAAAAASSVTLP